MKSLCVLEQELKCGTSLFFVTQGPPVKVRTTSLWAPKGRIHCWPQPLWNHQRHLSKSNCWTVDHWMLGGPVAGLTTMARLGNIPRPWTCYHLRLLCLHFHCPIPVQKFSLGTGTYVSANLHSWLLTNEFSVQPRGKAVKFHTFAAVFHLYYLQSSLFISTEIKLLTSVVCQRGVSISEEVTRAASNYLFICVTEFRILFFSYFSNGPFVMDQKMNWNITQALEKV